MLSNNELATLYVLTCPLLARKGLTRHLDIENKTLDVRRVRRDMRPYSHGERLLVGVAISLWNDTAKINLYELGCTLSVSNIGVVVAALQIAAGYGDLGHLVASAMGANNA